MARIEAEPTREPRPPQRGDGLQRAPQSGTGSKREPRWGGGVSLGRLFGVQIHVDWSLLIIFALVTISLGSAVFPQWHPDWPPLLVWGMAVGAAVLFFASVLVHELSHAIVARARGIPVSRVTLFLFGGVAQMAGEPKTPKDEFLVAIVGPITSLGIGVAAWAAGSMLGTPALSTASALEDPAAAMSRVGPLATLLLWLGPVNVLLGLFNMVPGFPLDGGRVLRALLWWTTGDLLKASRWASAAGQAVAWTLMGIGAWSLLAGGVAQGLWLLLIGWFLNNAARLSFESLVMRRALEGVSVREIMLTRLDRVPADITARDLAERHFMVSEQRAFPVESNGAFLGLVCFEDVRALPRDRWSDTTAAQLMTPVVKLTTLPPTADAESALDALAQRDVEQIPIVEDGKLLGLVRRRDILKWLALRDPRSGTAKATLVRAPA
jgi:Zn-dependent protease/CBS domain-containing protein